MNIIVANRQRVKQIDSRLLKRITAALLAELKITGAAIEINLLGAGEMAALNESFLRHEGPTDVITFDYGNSESMLKGEIFVCVDEAVLQARKFRTHWKSEIMRYVIHGVLHLLGNDDSTASLRRKMRRRENLLLGKLAGKFSLAQIGGAPKLRP
jgi:probable rRNA maturation factor